MASKKMPPSRIMEETFLFAIFLFVQFVSSNTQSSPPPPTSPPPSPPPPPVQYLLPPLQASILSEIKAAIDLTGTATSTWNSTAPCSSWTGVTCDTSLNVVSIVLTYVGLNGTLPSILGSLTSLVTLNFSGNWLAGPIPESLYSLSKLQILDLSRNNLNSTISASIRNLTSLTNLDLSNNLFTGNMTNYFGVLDNLVYLNLERNSLSGTIPNVFFGHLVLQTLNLAYNQFTGSIPTSITMLPAIVSLDLRNNGLNGTISSTLATSKTLKNLMLSTNSISGLIPTGFTLKTSPLLELSLGSNALTGSIPAWNPNNLTYLDLSANSFTGYLYSSFQTPPLSLRNLLLNNNSLEGPIPESFQNLTQLQVLDLSYNLLSGNLPVNLSKCSYLSRLDISFNLFSGPLPPSYTSFPKLQQLSIQSNSLSGTLNNYNFENMTSGVRLSLGSNQFSGGLPLGLPSPILTLDVSYNVLSGEINGSLFDFSRLPNMTAVLLNNNQFSGALPYQLWNNSVLQYVAANNNSIVSVPSTPISTSVENNLAYILLGGNPICTDSTTLSSVCVLAKALDLEWTPLNSTKDYPTKCYDSGNCPSPLFYSIPAYSNSESCICSKPLNVTFLLNQCPFLVYNQTFDLLSITLRTLASKVLQIPLNQIWIPAASLVDARGAQLIVMQFYGDSGDFVNINKALASKIVTKFQTIPSLFGKWGPLTFIDSELTGEGVSGLAELPVANTESVTIKAWAIALIVVGGFALGVILLLLYLLLRKPALGYKSMFDQEIEKYFVRHLTFQEVLEATNQFDRENVLGEGGYGTVYKGQTPDGTLWAVKKSKRSTAIGALEEFQKEVRTISRFAHTNIVKLVGYCENEAEQILVYEFCENGTLTQHLRPKEGRALKKPLTFEERLDIAIGTAEAIRYMHTFSTPAIIHRDIKSDNILLDADMQAKVADFGLLKDLPKSGKELEQNSHGIAGTPGYMDPEFFVTFRVTPKSDVYSFGVVLLELITGLPAVIQDFSSSEPQKTGLATWAAPHIKLNQWEPIIDPNLEGDFPPEAMEAMVKIAGDCVERISLQRPDIVEVANRLGSIKSTASQTVREETQRHSRTSYSDRVPLDVDLAFSNSVSDFRSRFGSVSSENDPGVNINVRSRK